MKIIRTINLIPMNESKTKVCLVKREIGAGSRAKYTFPSGTLNKDEEVSDSVQRISQEELGVKFENSKYLIKGEAKTKNAVIKTKYFMGEVPNNVKISRKYESYEWHNLNEELMFLEFLFDGKDVISELLEKLNNGI